MPGGAARASLALALALAWTVPPTAAGADVPGRGFLPDGRGWELVSPLEKNGGGVASPAEAGQGPFRAAAQGGAVAYASAASFADPEGAAPFSNYLAARGPSGWVTDNITPAHEATAYEGAPFVAFSADLARGLLENPTRCPEGDPCPAGYRLVELGSGSASASPDGPGAFAGASPDLRHVVFAAGEDLLRWSPPSSALVQLNDSPADALAAQRGAVSTDGSRVYWQGADGNLYLHEGGGVAQVDADAGGGGSFAGASADGSIAFFTTASHLWRYEAAGGSATDLTPAGGVSAVLGASPGGTRFFYLTTAGLFRWREGVGSEQLIGRGLADASAATAGVSAGGERLHFTTKVSLLRSDVNLAADVYQWQGQGTGSCTQAGGCVALISAGLAGSSSFAGASSSGDDVLFLTSRSLVSADPDAVDLYDARVGGGFPEPESSSPCLGDACQAVPPAPEDPTLTTVLAGPGNPAVRYRGATRNCRPIFRRAKRLSRGSRRSARRAKRLSRATRAGGAAGRAKQLERARRQRARSAKLRKRARRSARAARRCRASNRRAESQ